MNSFVDFGAPIAMVIPVVAFNLVLAKIGLLGLLLRGVNFPAGPVEKLDTELQGTVNNDDCVFSGRADMIISFCEV